MMIGDNEQAKPDPLHELMTLDQVAEYMQLHRSTVDRLVRNGSLLASRVGGTGHKRCKRGDVMACLTPVAAEKQAA